MVDARNLTLMLLTQRAPGATVCPSEVARALVATEQGGQTHNWRDVMPLVHAAVDSLVDCGRGAAQLERRSASSPLGSVSHRTVRFSFRLRIQAPARI